MSNTKYSKVLLKLSGEAISGDKGFGIDAVMLDNMCDVIKKLVSMQVGVAIVVGGGNFWRGRQAMQTIKRVTADYMGMLATIMNGQALQDALISKGVDAKLELPLSIKMIGEKYSKAKSNAYLKKGKVVIFAGGLWKPFYSTDTCAAKRAVDVSAEIILAGKMVDGVYSDDPKSNPNATKFDEISYQEIIEKELKVIDKSAAEICQKHNISTLIFALSDPENIIKAITGEKIGTIIK